MAICQKRLCGTVVDLAEDGVLLGEILPERTLEEHTSLHAVVLCEEPLLQFRPRAPAHLDYFIRLLIYFPFLPGFSNLLHYALRCRIHGSDVLATGCWVVQMMVVKLLRW